ncbi:MAG: di-heme-cytochrome C peroxidase [Polyangiales bacterium]
MSRSQTFSQRVITAAVVAVGFVGAAASAHAQTAQSLTQGWSSTQRHTFYRTTQGSRLIPYNLFVKLEMASSTQRFAGTTNMMALGFLIEPSTSDNPDSLPIGFVKDTQTGKPDAIGLTCAACHTRDITYQGTRYRLDGAQGYGDTERFLSTLQSALGATLGDAAKFERLRVATGTAAGSATTALRSSLQAAYDKIALENQSNLPPSGVNNPGPGRLDAFAHIKNRVANTVLAGNSSSTSNNVDATAPVSFPFLWDAPYLDFVQWPGNVTNYTVGSVGRNVGEVLGVFAETTVTRNVVGFVDVKSTANLNNLIALEDQLLLLKSPQWPSAFPPANPLLAALGQPLFNQYCGSCHVTVDRNPRTNYIKTFSLGASKVGTDPTMANNNANDRALAGATDSNPNKVVNPLDTLGSVVTPLLLPIAGQAFAINASHKQPALPATRNIDKAANETDVQTYKARPLNGIWATAPYLHNGSVRTLAQLLKPGPQREASFCVGSIAFSPADVGMANDCGVPNAYVFDTSKPGNSRLGHEYGTPSDTRFPVLTEAGKAALLEYMKTL